MAHRGWISRAGLTYDIKTAAPDAAIRAARRGDYASNVIGASTAPEAVSGAEAFFSVVTSDQAQAAALAAVARPR